MILNKDKYRRDSNEESKILEKMKKRKQCDNQNQENYENVGSEDRLSDLPDYVILHILSFLNTKHVVRTCVLSKRWKHLWKRIPTLILHASRFSTVKQFSVYVSKILTLRDSSSSLNVLDLDRHGDIEPLLLKKILNYVCSHSSHLEELGISVNGDSSLIMSCVSSCRALTSLMLSVYPRGGIFGSNYETLFPKSLNLPALTSLDLTNFVFCGDENGCAEPFSAFTKLNSLVLSSCTGRDAQVLNISSETLVNLALHYNSSEFPKIELSAPSLCTFTFTGTPRQKICGSGLSSVKQVNISADIISRCDAAPMILLSWLLDLANVKSLTVTSTALWMLSLVPDLLEVKLPSLCILKSMEIKLEPLCVQGALLYMVKDAMLKKAAANSRKEVARLRREFKAGSQPSSIPDGMVNFLLQNSSSAKVDITTVY
ncbi:F-box/LRR-repeat protein At4g14103-like isoform X1 [Trifolium pratense]|nr:F-box/LRR-repeat protein At4g14103-like isoform X1 [Trifolium pratense]